jgi:hypothetical protein
MYINPLKPYTLAGFEPGIVCSVGGRDDHYATPPGVRTSYFSCDGLDSFGYFLFKTTTLVRVRSHDP